jgi:hypothetical protein
LAIKILGKFYGDSIYCYSSNTVMSYALFGVLCEYNEDIKSIDSALIFEEG